MQLEMGMSTRRYLPASGTAGLDRSLVSGNRRVPAPPPIMTASTLLVLGDIRLPCVISELFLSCGRCLLLYTLPHLTRASGKQTKFLCAALLPAYVSNNAAHKNFVCLPLALVKWGKV